MAEPTSVHSQITDSVTQTNANLLGDASAVAMANLYQATAQALANAAHNATMAQQQNNIIAQAATAANVNLLLSIGANGFGFGATCPNTNSNGDVQR